MILDQIVADVRQRLPHRKKEMPLEELKHFVDKQDTPRDFLGALRGKGIEVIAEIKRASPSKGWLCPDMDVAKLAGSYARGGAAAISVLTEPNYFKGDIIYLNVVRRAVELPLLRKDFIIDAYQIYEARAYGADAVLLIASILSLSELSELLDVTRSLGMEALVETHNEQEVENALNAGAKLIGINNRNLVDFSVDLGTTIKLRSLIPNEITVVSESGIKSYNDITSLQEVEVNAVLVGETLVSSPDPGDKLRELRGESS